MIYPPALRLFPLAWLLLASLPALAFQVADGTPPASSTSGKYILYWGKHQCNLSEVDGYRSALSLSTTEFRQMLIGAPKVWNGVGIVKNLRFKIEGVSVSADDYLGQLAQLDAQLSPKIKPGNLLRLTELTLEEGILGAIDINLQSKKEGAKESGNTPQQPDNLLNKNFLEKAVWGREDIYEISNRDFFTVGEFWNSIRQEPAVVWASYRKPQILRSEINFTSKDNTSIGVVTRLENDMYRVTLESLDNFRHMVHPGATVALQLQTAEQYELLYKKTMRIVADNDPRLRLRRKRDQHTVTIRWGSWGADLEGLYLQHLPGPLGETLETDMPIRRTDTFTFSDDISTQLGANKPEFRVDGEPVSGMVSFRVTVADSLVYYVNSDTYDADSTSRFLMEKDLVLDNIKIDSIQMEGYELPSVSFSIYVIWPFGKQLAPNLFDGLKRRSEKPSVVTLLPPEMTATELTFTFELSAATPGVFSIFEPNGLAPFIYQRPFQPGTVVIKVPRAELRDKGKYFAFFNSKLGVARVEFMVD